MFFDLSLTFKVYFSCFVTFKSEQDPIRIWICMAPGSGTLIRIEIKSWIRIRNETNANPQTLEKSLTWR